MGRDRIHDHEQAGTEVLTANDMSCLMHLEGLLRREKKPMRVMHIAEILAEATRSVPQLAGAGDQGMKRDLGTRAVEEKRSGGEEEIARTAESIDRKSVALTGNCGIEPNDHHFRPSDEGRGVCRK